MCFYKKINKKINNDKNGILLKQYEIFKQRNDK
jgi:hypothetical protein